MHGKIAKSLLMVVAGLALCAVGLATAAPELRTAQLPLRSLVLVGGLAALVVGVWLCWGGLARHVRPPEVANRIVGLLGVGL
ncbi:unnamed protein product, partial [marine sediment metagenome]